MVAHFMSSSSRTNERATRAPIRSVKLRRPERPMLFLEVIFRNGWGLFLQQLPPVDLKMGSPCVRAGRRRSWQRVSAPPPFIRRRRRSGGPSARSPSGRRRRHSRPGWPRNSARPARKRHRRRSHAPFKTCGPRGQRIGRVLQIAGAVADDRLGHELGLADFAVHRAALGCRGHAAIDQLQRRVEVLGEIGGAEAVVGVAIEASMF